MVENKLRLINMDDKISRLQKIIRNWDLEELDKGRGSCRGV